MSINNNSRVFLAQNRFNSYYEIDYENLTKLYDLISGESLVNRINKMFTDTSQAITSIRAYPFKIPSKELGAYDYMTICGTRFADGNVSPKASRFYYQTTGFIQVVAGYQLPDYTNALQIEPFTTAQLYLPYIGYTDIIWNEFIGNRLYIDYLIDYASGFATAYVRLADKDTGKERVVLIKSGKIGFEVAWGKTNMAENLRNIASTVFNTALSLYTLGASNVNEALKVAGRVSTISKAGVSVLNSLQIKYERGGSVEGLGRTADPTTPHIILKSQNEKPVVDFEKIYGRPLYETYELSKLRGYTVVDEIHLTDLPDALDEEVTDIENLLKSGVHL